MAESHVTLTAFRKIILLLSLALAAVVITCSLAGLLIPGFYDRETPSWQAQSLGQDLVDLVVVVPCLLLTAFLASRGKSVAILLWGGVMAFLTYTFVLYCFDVHFNRLFWVYCLGLGLSFYGTAYFLFYVSKQMMNVPVVHSPVIRFTGTYFLVISILFYALWLKEVLPSMINNEVPASIIEAGLLTNGVHALDLSIVLPAIFLAGIGLRKGNAFAVWIAPAFLAFFVLMTITIATLVGFMANKGLPVIWGVAGAMILLTVFSLALLALNLKERSRQ